MSAAPRTVSVARQVARSLAPRVCDAVSAAVGTVLRVGSPDRTRLRADGPALSRAPPRTLLSFSLPRTVVLLTSTKGISRLLRGPHLALCLFFYSPQAKLSLYIFKGS